MNNSWALQIQVIYSYSEASNSVARSRVPSQTQISVIPHNKLYIRNLDHVAMVLKFEQDEQEIFLLDATYHNGVAI